MGMLWWSNGGTTGQRIRHQGDNLCILYCPETDRRGSGFAFSLTCGYRVRLMEGNNFHQAQKTAKTLQMEQLFFHQEHPERLILHDGT